MYRANLPDLMSRDTAKMALVHGKECLIEKPIVLIKSAKFEAMLD